MMFIISKKKRPVGLAIYKVSLNDWKQISPILARTKVESNFSCFPQLWTFALKKNDQLILLDFADQKKAYYKKKKN